MDETSLQDLYAPAGRCFGCGPANEHGLRIKSHVAGDEVVAAWCPETHYEAYDGALNGGIIATLLDCHGNWTATHHLMRASGAETPPCTVTGALAVRYLRPTPTSGPVRLRAHVVESSADRATVEAVIEADGEPTATCRATYVAVKPGHPAYHRW